VADDIVQELRDNEENLLSPLVKRLIQGGDVSPPLGWIDLVLDLDRKLSYIQPDYIIYQVKEKFGSLRYYIEYSEGIPGDIMYDLIRLAESKSSKICQACGEPGDLTFSNKWYATLCEDHVTKD